MSRRYRKSMEYRLECIRREKNLSPTPKKLEPEGAARLVNTVRPEAEDVDVDLCGVGADQPLPAGSEQQTDESSTLPRGPDEAREQVQSGGDYGDDHDHDAGGDGSVSHQAQNSHTQNQLQTDETHLERDVGVVVFEQSLAEQAVALSAVEQNLDLIKSQVTDLTWRVRAVEGVQRLRHQLDEAIAELRSARQRQEEAEAARDAEARRRLDTECSYREQASKAEQLERSLASERAARIATEEATVALRAQVANLTRKVSETEAALQRQRDEQALDLTDFQRLEKETAGASESLSRAMSPELGHAHDRSDDAKTGYAATEVASHGGANTRSDETVHDDGDSLHPRFHAFKHRLVTRGSWQVRELELVARENRFMLREAFEAINTWSWEELGDWLVQDEGQEWLVNARLVRTMNSD